MSFVFRLFCVFCFCFVLNSEENPAASIQDDFFLGGFTTASNLEIAEIIVYSEAITGDVREAIETVLAEKWNITDLLDDDDDETLDIIGSALVFPNPFRAQESAQYGYELVEDTDVELYLFNSMGRLVKKTDYMSGSVGGQAGYNKVDVETQSAFGKQLPAGAYFFLLVSQGDVIGKGKFAVIP